MSVSTVTSGKAAIKPPSLSLRLATSEIKTTKPAVIAYLKIIQLIVIHGFIEKINSNRIVLTIFIMQLTYRCAGSFPALGPKIKQALNLELVLIYLYTLHSALYC